MNHEIKAPCQCRANHLGIFAKHRVRFSRSGVGPESLLFLGDPDVSVDCTLSIKTMEKNATFREMSIICGIQSIVFKVVGVHQVT